MSRRFAELELPSRCPRRHTPPALASLQPAQLSCSTWGLLSEARSPGEATGCLINSAAPPADHLPPDIEQKPHPRELLRNFCCSLRRGAAQPRDLLEQEQKEAPPAEDSGNVCLGKESLVAAWPD